MDCSALQALNDLANFVSTQPTVEPILNRPAGTDICRFDDVSNTVQDTSIDNGADLLESKLLEVENLDLDNLAESLLSEVVDNQPIDLPIDIDLLSTDPWNINGDCDAGQTSTAIAEKAVTLNPISCSSTDLTSTSISTPSTHNAGTTASLSTPLFNETTGNTSSTLTLEKTGAVVADVGGATTVTSSTNDDHGTVPAVSASCADTSKAVTATVVSPAVDSSKTVAVENCDPASEQKPLLPSVNSSGIRRMYIRHI